MTENNATTGPESEPGTTKDAMPAEFGLGMAIFVVVASMVGTGVLTTSGYTVATVGSNQWMLILWVVGGLTAVCGALTLAELSAAMPRTGGDYVYLHEAYGPLPAFLSGWVSFLIGFAGPGAAAGFASAKYLLGPFKDSLGMDIVLLERLVATGLILAFAAIHVLGRRQTEHVQAWITAIKLVLLAGFAAAGLYAGWPNSGEPPRLHADHRRGALMGLLTSLVYIYYAYTGWNAASYMAGEVRDPQRLLPRAILLGTGGVLLLYMAVNVMYALALTPADLQAIIKDPANKEGFDAVAPIAELAARRLFGTYWARPLSVAVGIMLLSSLSAYLLIGPRVIFAMAEAGQFPAMAARLTRKARTPGIATALPARRDAGLALDGHGREPHPLRGRRPVDLLDAGDELDLRPALEAARPAPSLPHARVSGHARSLPRPDRDDDLGGVPHAAQGVDVCPPEHPGRRAVLLPLAVHRRPEAGRGPFARVRSREGIDSGKRIPDSGWIERTIV